ncbi:SDR family oxidoreductase [Dyadobacter sp. 676]|uniref:SDR family oxidoreductase n=1 Tax=Dyadobacter sp. 676 TaxID=3088362 RepID=A0AAU8FJS3_9BACT
MKQANIFLTGATGTVGAQLVQRLASMQVPFKALVRSGSNAGVLKNLPLAEVTEGNLDNPASFEHALRGVETAFLLTNSSEKAESLQMNFVQAAYEAGVKHIVKLSQFAADESSPVRFLRYHARVEKRIRDLGFAYTFLRPNLYMQGLLAFKTHIRDSGRFFAAIGKARVSAVDVRDIAAVAAAALTQDGHRNKVYDITGPQSLSHYEMAGTFSTVLGKPVTFVDVTPAQMEAALQAAGFPEWQVGGLIEDYAHYARGEAQPVYDTVQRVTGQNAVTFKQFVREHSFLFR